jgi:hypothetical protein
VAVLAELDQEAVLCEDVLFAASEALNALASLRAKKKYQRTIFPGKAIAGGGFPLPAWLPWLTSL